MPDLVYDLELDANDFEIAWIGIRGMYGTVAKGYDGIVKCDEVVDLLFKISEPASTNDPADRILKNSKNGNEGLVKNIEIIRFTESQWVTFKQMVASPEVGWPFQLRTKAKSFLHKIQTTMGRDPDVLDKHDDTEKAESS